MPMKNRQRKFLMKKDWRKNKQEIQPWKMLNDKYPGGNGQWKMDNENGGKKEKKY